MARNLRGRSFLKLLDFTPEDVRYLLDLARNFKDLKRTHTPHKYLEGRNVALLFEKTSTRTRCAFEVAARDLGMGVTYLDPAGSQMGHKESMEDTAKVLGRFFDGIEYRGFSQTIVEGLAKWSGVPVWNGLTDEFHPTQVLADLLTIEEHFGRLKGLKCVFMGDARNNVANSLMIACAMAGVNFTACAPNELFPNAELVARARAIAKTQNAEIAVESDVEKSVHNANVLYTDIWVSMGEPKEIWAERIKLLTPYQVNRHVMEMASPDAVFLHCLPSFHDRNTVVGEDIYQKFGISEMEVTDAVFRSRKSLVFEEAENRMHTIKAVMFATLA